MADYRTLALEKLNTEHRSGATAPKKGRKAIPLEELTTEEAVFQMRVDGIVDKWVAGLMKKITEGNGKLDPLLVWWTGQRWVVMDGHHRLEAYRNHAHGKATYRNIPVVISKAGTVTEARFEANRENSKDKLNTTEDDKTQLAWSYTVEGLKVSKAGLYEATGVSVSTIGRMRSLSKKMLGTGWPQDELIKVGWKAASEMFKADNGWLGHEVDEDDYEGFGPEGRRWAKRLRDEFGTMLTKAPATAAVMLLEYGENTAKLIFGSTVMGGLRQEALMEELEAVEELREEMEAIGGGDDDDT